MKSYETYTSEDFIQDEYFLKWVKDNNAEAAIFWKRWLKAHPEKKNEIEIAKYSVQNLQYKTTFTLSDSEHTQLFENILKSESPVQKNYNPLHYKWLKYAAIVLPIVAATYFFYFEFTNEREIKEELAIVEFEERYYPKGRKATLRLGDSTQININADSKISFPKSFTGIENREVYLEGEAFFNVKRDTLKPFKVFTGNLITEVLGTSFNIDADPLDKIIQVTVASGRVAVSDSSGNRIILTKGEYVLYNKSDRTFSKKFAQDLTPIIGWKEGKLVFEREAIQNVFDVLERWYGIEFIGEENVTGFYTGNFKNETLEKILDGISYTSNFTYTIKGKIVNIN